MFRNYIRVAWRNIVRNKSYLILNITGLAVGMAVAMLIGLWVWKEYSYETANPEFEHIARVMQFQTQNGDRTAGSAVPIPLATELRTAYGNMFKHVAVSSWTRDHSLSNGENSFIERGKFMEPDGPEMLGLIMLHGSKDVLNDPSAVLFSAAVAKTLFGNTDVVGKVVRINNRISVTVKGVYADMPDNTVFKDLGFIAPLDLYTRLDSWIKAAGTNWNDDAGEVLVQLADNANINEVSAAIRNTKFNKVKNDKEAAAYKPELFLQPMSRWHLYSEFTRGENTGGRIRFVRLFAVIGAFILLLACINFMNLSTAHSERRAKEVGIRKTLGSERVQLIFQFFNESLLTVLLAFSFCLVLVWLALPLFNKVADTTLAMPWEQPDFWLAGLAFVLGTALVAGSYPAFYLSGFQPVKVLKGTFKAGRFSALPRKVLVVLQFTVSVILIIGTIVVYRQIQYAKDRPTGYSKERLIAVKIVTPDFWGKEALLRNELLRTGAVTEMATASSPVTSIWFSYSGFDWKGKDPDVPGELGAVAVSHGYGKTIGWQLADGRDFSDAFADSAGVVLNEAAVHYMGLKGAVDEQVKWNGQSYTVIGVVKNMLMESPYAASRPTVYYLPKDNSANFMFIRLTANRSSNEAVQTVKAVLQRYVPSSPFDFRFVEDEFARKFAEEEHTGRLASLFAMLAIFISCLGVFGMASYMAEQRFKEIGVRKVLGASVMNLWVLLTRDFVVMVIVAVMIATPVAYALMFSWLNNYQYRSAMPLWIFVVAGFCALVITLCTISFQVIKAALANPGKSLRLE